MNLIGEHVDYNDGLVLADRDRSLHRVIAAGPSPDAVSPQMESNLVRQNIIQTHDRFLMSSDSLPWAAYVLGPLLLCREQGLAIRARITRR